MSYQKIKTIQSVLLNNGYFSSVFKKQATAGDNELDIIASKAPIFLDNL